jgi:VWFA-related protein
MLKTTLNSPRLISAMNLTYRRIRFLLLPALILFVTLGTQAQDKPLAQREVKPKPTPDENGLVKLWVVAIGPGHKIPQDLTQKDFRIFVDKKEQEIVYFSPRPREPLRVGVLLDVSEGRPIDKPDALEAAPISQFLRTLLGRDDRAFIATFNDSVSLLCPWTAKPEELDDALKRAFSVEFDGPPMLLDAIYTLCEERFSSEPGRKALIVLSDSPDDGSGHTQIETLEMAHRTDTILYPMLPWERTLSAPLFKNVQFAQIFGNDTGGFFYFVVDRKDLVNSLKGISTFLSHFYELTFRPDIGPHDGRYHSIKVKCRRSGVKLTTREGYYAPKG